MAGDGAGDRRGSADADVKTRLGGRLLKKRVERVAGVALIPRNLAVGRGRGRRGRRSIARYCHTRLEQRALVGFVLQRNPYRNRLQALETRGGFEVGALLAAVQRSAAFRAVAGEIGAGGKLRRAVEAARRRDCLHQAWQPGTSDVNGWTWALLSGPFVAVTLGFEIRALGIHIAPLFVLAIAIHGEIEFTP